jgi:hypothetical protein
MNAATGPSLLRKYTSFHWENAMKLIRALYGELSPWGRFWLLIGFVTLFAAALMSMSFGSSISAKHALFLGCLTVVAAFAPDAAHQQWRAGAKPTACVVAALCIPLLMIEFYSHAGYTAGLRGANVQDAHIQNTRYDDGRAQVADNKANLELWKKQLADLNTENAWAASVTAVGLRADLKTANEAVDQEKARGGCGPICLTKMKARDAIAQKIAVVEKSEDLTKRIEATQRLVDKYRVASAQIEHKVSSVDLQNQFLAKTVALVSSGSLQPTAIEDAGSDQVINFSMAMAGTGLPALCFFLAGCFRFREAEDVLPSAPRNDVPKLVADGGKLLEASPSHLDSHFSITDERGLNKLRDEIAGHAARAYAMLQPHLGATA